jgi:hypothetical protein
MLTIQYNQLEPKQIQILQTTEVVQYDTTLFDEIEYDTTDLLHSAIRYDVTYD